MNGKVLNRIKCKLQKIIQNMGGYSGKKIFQCFNFTEMYMNLTKFVKTKNKWEMVSKHFTLFK